MPTQIAVVGAVISFTFEIGNGVLLASTFVDGVTFVPDQLSRAITSTFALASDHEALGEYLRGLAESELAN